LTVRDKEKRFIPSPALSRVLHSMGIGPGIIMGNGMGKCGVTADLI